MSQNSTTPIDSLLLKYPWYHQDIINRTAIERLIANTSQANLFLLRKKGKMEGKPGFVFALSVKQAPDSVRHYLLSYCNPGLNANKDIGFYINTTSIPPSENGYDYLGGPEDLCKSLEQGQIVLETATDSNGNPVREKLYCKPLTRPNYINQEANVGVYNQITTNGTSVHSNYNFDTNIKSTRTGTRTISTVERLEPISGKLLMKEKRALWPSSTKSYFFKCDDKNFEKYVVDPQYASQPTTTISLNNILTIAPTDKSESQFYIEISQKPTLKFTTTDEINKSRDWWVSELNKRWKSAQKNGTRR